MTRPFALSGPSLFGASALAAMALISALAPLLATDTPWLARESGTLRILSRRPVEAVPFEVVLRSPIPFAPNDAAIERALEPPSAAHPCGTDGLGRDVLSRLIHGGRRSLAAALTATVTAIVLGVGLGALAGMSGRVTGGLLARGADIVNAFPALVGALVLIGTGDPPLPRSVWIGFVIGLFSWPGLFRYARGEVRRFRASDIVASARLAGAGTTRIAVMHVLPNALAPVLGPASFVAGGAVLAEAGLGFLGLGFPVPDASWGSLLGDARNAMVGVGSAWWLVLFPGATVFLTVLSCQLLADGLRGARSTPDRA